MWLVIKAWPKMTIALSPMVEAQMVVSTHTNNIAVCTLKVQLWTFLEGNATIYNTVLLWWVLQGQNIFLFFYCIFLNALVSIVHV